LEAQSAAKVLVAPLATSTGIDEEFGEEVAEELRKRLEDFDGVELLKQRTLDNALKMFIMQTQATTLTTIHWRQIGGQLEADLVLIGSVNVAGSDVQIGATLVEPWWGDEIPLPDFTVPGDGGAEAKEGAVGIAQGFGQQLAYLGAVRRCGEYLDAAQFDEALQSCNQALELRLDGMQAYYSRARALMGLQRWEEAVPDLETALSVGPRLAVTVVANAVEALALSNLQLGNAELATDLYRQYLQLDPRNVDERLSVATTLLEAGQVEAARGIAEEGLALDPTDEALAAFLESPVEYATAAADPANAPPCQVWTGEIKNRLPVEVEAYLYDGEVVPLSQARGRQARGRLLRTIRENGLDTVTLTGPNPVLMFYEYRPARQAERELVIVGGVARYVITVEAQQESRTMFALVSPFAVEPHDMRRLTLQFTCESN
jgi:TolB-like protein